MTIMTIKERFILAVQTMALATQHDPRYWKESARQPLLSGGSSREPTPAYWVTRIVDAATQVDETCISTESFMVALPAQDFVISILRTGDVPEWVKLPDKMPCRIIGEPLPMTTNSR